MSSEQLCELIIRLVSEDRLVKYDQSHWTTIGLVGVNAER
jgi:hypothetical protein